MTPQYKVWIIEELTSWAETFNNDYPSYMQDVMDDENNSYNEIKLLIEKFSKDECSEKDYENILFHIWQINED